MFRAPLLVSLLATSFALVACGPSGPTPEQIAAKKKAEEEEAAKKADLERRKAERKAAAEAEEKAEKERLEKIAALATLPAELPKKLEKACEETAAANDAFMQRMFPDTVEKWNAAKGTQLGMMKKGCLDAGSIEVAACQKEAMTNAPEELKKALPDLLRACIEKYGTPPEGADAKAG